MSEPCGRCDICGGNYFGIDPDGICPSCEKAEQANEEQRSVLEELATLRAKVEALEAENEMLKGCIAGDTNAVRIFLFSPTTEEESAKLTAEVARLREAATELLRAGHSPQTYDAACLALEKALKGGG